MPLHAFRHWGGASDGGLSLPVGSLDVALAFGAGSADGRHEGAIVGLELVLEVAVAVILAVVAKDGDRVVLGAGGGEGHGGQAGEDDLG